MLYIAIAMILVGVLCFVYVSLSPQNNQKPKDSDYIVKEKQGNQEDNRLSGSQPRRRHSLSNEELNESINYSRSPKPNPENEEKFIREREINYYPQQNVQQQNNPSSQSPDFQKDQTVVYTSPKPIEDTPEIVESVKILGKEGEILESTPEERLIVQGLVYLDSKGKLPMDNRDFPERVLKEEFFQEIRRIGDGALFEESGKLIFRVKNHSYTFESRDLKKVVFYDEAVVFLPNRFDYASVIFFTSDPDSIKAFFAQAESQLARKE